MPPSISRSSLSALSRCRGSTTILPTRSFSATSTTSAIGPESPKFIEVPTLVQPQITPKLQTKGLLPPPRDIFKRRSGFNKFLKKVEEPSFENLPAAPSNEISKERTNETIDIERGQQKLGGALHDYVGREELLPGQTLDYNTPIEKAKGAIIEQARTISGRVDRAHELATLQKHAHHLNAWPGYFKAVTPEPSNETEPANDYEAWKRRMAASRRANLQKGLIALSYRKATRSALVSHVGREKARTRQKLLTRPQREDERLTNPTILAAVSTLQQGAALPDPNRAERVAASAARVRAKELVREEARKDALHTLYMHARDFIVTEKQLDDEIEKIFTDTPHAENDHRSSIWDVKGAPVTVHEMLTDADLSKGGRAMRFHRPGALKSSERMKKIAEQLTGGKMD